MRYRSVSIHVVGATGYASADINSETGVLVAASLRVSPTSTGAVYRGAGELYGQILLMPTDNPKPFPMFALSQGYFGGSIFLPWQGRIPLSPAMAIRGTVYNDADSDCVLNCMFAEAE